MHTRRQRDKATRKPSLLGISLHGFKKERYITYYESSETMRGGVIQAPTGDPGFEMGDRYQGKRRPGYIRDGAINCHRLLNPSLNR